MVCVGGRRRNEVVRLVVSSLSMMVFCMLGMCLLILVNCLGLGG